MATDNNDEYQFSDSDIYTPGQTATPTPQAKKKWNFGGDSPILRNLIILVAVVFLIVIIYKFSENWNRSKPKVALPTISTETIIAPKKIIKPVITLPPPPRISQLPTAKVEISPLLDRLTTVEAVQQNNLSKLEDVSITTTKLDSNVENLESQIKQLNSLTQRLLDKINAQNMQIKRIQANQNRLFSAKRQANKKKNFKFVYNLQAAVAGRAWLISANGSTLTISEGTKLQGYGLVKLIDPIQGKVFTSSGRTIGFKHMR